MDEVSAQMGLSFSDSHKKLGSTLKENDLPQILENQLKKESCSWSNTNLLSNEECV